MIPSDEIKKLRDIASKATKGEWFYIPYIRVHGIATKIGPDHRKFRLATCPLKHGNDAEFIAAFNPSTALKLLDAYSLLLKQNQKMSVVLQWYANRDNWRFDSYKGDCKDMINMSDIGVKSFNGENNFADYACGSGGRRAREVLEEINKAREE